MNDYKTLNKSKFCLQYHLIFVCKYRKKLLTKYGSEIKQILYDISNKADFDIIEMEVDKDHIHFMISASPKVSVSMIVRKLKSESTINIWKKHFSELSKVIWNKIEFWSDGYFCSTIGQVSKETLKRYIRNQG